MDRLGTLEARMRAVDTKLGELDAGLRQDVTMLKALVAALREQAADPVTLDKLDELATSIEGRVANLSTLDQETPPPAPPV